MRSSQALALVAFRGCFAFLLALLIVACSLLVGCPGPPVPTAGASQWLGSDFDQRWPPPPRRHKISLSTSLSLRRLFREGRRLNVNATRVCYSREDTQIQHGPLPLTGGRPGSSPTLVVSEAPPCKVRCEVHERQEVVGEGWETFFEIRCTVRVWSRLNRRGGSESRVPELEH
jgi:hypothetical protein